MGKVPVIPMDASPELALCLKFAAGNCQWCIDENLLAGDYDVPRLEERWSFEELEELRTNAARLREKRANHRRYYRPPPPPARTQQVIA